MTPIQIPSKDQLIVPVVEQKVNKQGYVISSGNSFTESLINFDLQKH